MIRKRVCGVFSLVALGLVAYTSLGAMALSTSEVQAIFAEVFRPQINFGLAASVLNLLAEFGLLVAVSFLAVAQLIPQETIPPSGVTRHNNRFDQISEVEIEA